MPISCQAIQSQFDRGLALLHSFWYDRALLVFDDAIKREPTCQIAYWGAAMTFNHPLWQPPNASDIRAARDYLQRGRNAQLHDERESGYFHAVSTLFGDGNLAAKSERDDAYMQEMKAIHKRFPDDETTLFYALSIIGSPGYVRDPAKIEEAGALVEAVHARQPEHPGALHYTIHAYDLPGYEPRALDAARHYALSAPEIPHALHMPSHTFLALGLWGEAVKTERRAWEASVATVNAAGEPGYLRDFHVMRFYVYEQLQLGHFAEAKQLRDIVLAQYRDDLRAYASMPREKADETFDLTEPATTITDYAYETGDYTGVDELADTALGLSAPMAVREARGFRALRVNKVDEARANANALRAMATDPATAKMWRLAPTFAEIAADELAGAIALHDGKQQDGFALFDRAAQAESTLPRIFQPASIPPAHELYGQYLLASGHYGDAQREFRAALARMPNRRISEEGLRKAEAAGTAAHCSR